MKKYLSFFKLRFAMSLQYRVAALAGVVCQFFPMDFQATASYIWLQQGLLAMLALYGGTDAKVFESIQNGNIVYELCRPVSIYSMWFANNLANRLARALLRLIPVVAVAAPPDVATGLLFILSLMLALWVVAAFTLVVYNMTFFTISDRGVRLVSVSLSDFLMGAVVPLPFFPDGFRQFAELLPFSCMENVPLRVYSGDLAGPEMVRAILLQVFWAFALVLIGKLLERKALKRVVVQGG